MDKLQDKILNLQLLESKVREYPGRLLNCMKFSMDFDKEYSKDAVQKKKVQVQELRSQLELFLKQSRAIQAIKDDTVRAAEGNRPFFNNLMVQYGVAVEEIADLMGESPISEDGPNPGSVASSEAGEDLQDDDDELSYELGKENLTQYTRFKQKNSIE